MIAALQSMSRRKTRTSLTVLGIVIGVFTLTVMGALAEKLNLLTSGGTAYFSGYVTVTPAGSAGFGEGAPIAVARARDLARVPGVALVVPVVELPVVAGQTGGLGLPDLIEGIGPTIGRHEKVTPAAEGTIPSLAERGVVTVGATIAREYKLHAGSTFVVRGRPFRVAAILQTTLTAPDTMVRMNLQDAQEIAVAALPAVVRGSLAPSAIASRLTVYPRAGLDADALAARIVRAGIADIKVISPTATKQQFAQTSAVFDLIVLGSSVIALIVGALSVLNTMAMAVAERVKEIGLKKAIGARTGQVLREFVLEATVIGLLGGLLGLGLGAVLVDVINAVTASTGTVIFAITARLVAGTLLFATLLGALAGFIPAWQAARLNPVTALRAE